MPNNIIIWNTRNSNKSIEYNNKFTTIMLNVISIILLTMKLGNIYNSAELSNNTDAYVQVYNNLKSINQSSI